MNAKAVNHASFAALTYWSALQEQSARGWYILDIAASAKNLMRQRWLIQIAGEPNEVYVFGSCHIVMQFGCLCCGYA
jgi:hypothetical protein